MSITLPHFDTKLQASTGAKEEVKNSLAEYLFPETSFAITEIYSGCTAPEDLREHQGMTAQFSNGKKVYFGTNEVRDKVYPNMSDGAAYGSLVFTPCKDFKELKNLRILVVDDETGFNGGVIPKEQAKKMVGDCYGRMSPDLGYSLTGQTNTPFQFRLGIKPQQGSDVHRIAKGTLAPSRELESLGTPKISHKEDGYQTKVGYDLILATSSFKGRLDETKIQPGEHTLTVGIGIKTLANYSKHSLGTQVLVNYPKGVAADILKRVETAAQHLADIQSDPRKIAQYFIDKHSRQLHRQSVNSFEEETEGFELESEYSHGGSPHEYLPDSFAQVFGIEDNLSDEPLLVAQKQYDENFYSLLQTCVDNHPQLLEHPNIVSKLTELIRKEWVDIATGRAIEFQSGLAQPSLELLQNEVCVPHIPEGEKLIVTRSPLINSNGVVTLTNKHLTEFQHEQGTIHIHPETAAAYLQADFDGDRLAFEKASLYPTLTAEIEEKQLPHNRHTDVIKAEKKPYSAETFGEIAIAASSNKIGLIANSIQQAVAIETEIDELTMSEQVDFLRVVKGQCISALNLNVDAFNIPSSKKEQCRSIQEKAYILGNLGDVGVGKEETEANLKLTKQLFKEVTDILSNELQTAADGPKSAARPNEDVLELANTILKAREVGWISDKKQKSVYSSRIMETTNHSPIDKMIRATNKTWVDHHLESLPTHQFKDFFPKNYTPEQEATAKTLTKTYNTLYAEAKALSQEADMSPGAQLVVTSAKSGNQIILLDLVKYNHPDVWTSNSLDIKLSGSERTGSLTAMARLQNDCAKGKKGEWKLLGTVSERSRQEHNLVDGMTLSNAFIQLTKGTSFQQKEALLKEARDFIEKTRSQYGSSDEAKALQSAIWHTAHASNQKGYENYARASAAFNIFPELVAERAKEFQFDEITLAGMHQPTNEWGQNLNGKTIDFQVVLETRENHPNFNKRVVMVEGKQVAPISEKDYQLPIGTQGRATLTSPPGATLIATTAKGNTVKITQLSKHDFAGLDFSKEQSTLTIGFVTPPGKDNPVPVAKIGDKILGVIDKSDCQKLSAAKLLRPGASIKCELQSNPATTATLTIEKDTLSYPYNWIKQSDASKQAWIQNNLESTSHTVEPVSPDKPYERPEWEQHLVKAALRTLNNVQPNEFGERMAVMGQTLVTYTDNEQGRTLKVVDLNHQGRGILYKAEAGKAPIVDNFTPTEKQQFALQVIPKKTKSDTLLQ
jgi:hypothetical protein